MEQIRHLLLLLFCIFPPLECDEATVRGRFTPSQPETTTGHAMTKDITTIKPSQKPNTAVYTAKHETPISSMYKAMSLTTERPGLLKALQTASNEEKPNSTSAVQMNASHTTALLRTTPSPLDAHRTDLSERWNLTVMTTAGPSIRKSTLSPRKITKQRLLTQGTSENPKTTTATGSGDGTTREPTPQKQTTMKSTTRTTVHTEKPKTPSGKQQPNESHGIAAAIIIGLILLMMFVGIIFIMVKKHKWQKRQLENSEWAGPSPFLDGSAQPNFSRDRDSTRQDSKRISIAGFLPQKRQSLLNDMDEGLDMEILQATTFGQSNTPETKAANGTSQEMKEETENKQEVNSTVVSFSENLQMTVEAANHDPNPTTVIKEDRNSSDADPNKTPSAQPPPATTNTDIPPPPPETEQPSSEETSPATASTDILPPPPEIDHPPSEETTPATVPTDMPPPPPELDQPPSEDTPPVEPTPASEAQIPPPPPLP